MSTFFPPQYLNTIFEYMFYMVDNFHIPLNDILSFTVSDIETLIIKNEDKKKKKIQNINDMGNKLMLNIDIEKYI